MMNADLLAGYLAILGSAFIMVVCFAAAVLLVSIVSYWKLYEKAGEKGWAAIIPFYSDYVRAKITWGNGWIFLLPLAAAFVSAGAYRTMWLVSLCTLVSIVYYAITCLKLAKAFGQSALFAVGIFFFSIIFLPLLAFGSSQYLGVPNDALSLNHDKKAQ